MLRQICDQSIFVCDENLYKDNQGFKETNHILTCEELRVGVWRMLWRSWRQERLQSQDEGRNLPVLQTFGNADSGLHTSGPGRVGNLWLDTSQHSLRLRANRP